MDTAQKPLEWLRTLHAGMGEDLDVIINVHERLLVEANKGYYYAHVLQEQIRKLPGQYLTRNSDGKYVPRHIQTSATARVDIIAWVNDTRACHQMLGTLIATNRLSVVRHLDSFMRGLDGKDLLVPLVCMRSVVEHVAHLHSVIKQLEPLSVPESSDEANHLLGQICDELAQKTWGTRIDWFKLMKIDAKDELDREELKYRTTEIEADRSAAQILNAIDRLDKAVPGTRATYEVLCEFAHPNCGTQLASTIGVRLEQDRWGVFWVKKELGLGAPMAFAESGREIVAKLMSQLAKTLAHYEIVLKAGVVEEAKLLHLTRAVVKRLIRSHRECFDVYALCPCGSGTKLKFCCWS